MFLYNYITVSDTGKTEGRKSQVKQEKQEPGKINIWFVMIIKCFSSLRCMVVQYYKELKNNLFQDFKRKSHTSYISYMKSWTVNNMHFIF